MGAMPISIHRLVAKVYRIVPCEVRTDTVLSSQCRQAGIKHSNSGVATIGNTPGIFTLQVVQMPLVRIERVINRIERIINRGMQFQVQPGPVSFRPQRLEMPELFARLDRHYRKFCMRQHLHNTVAGWKRIRSPMYHDLTGHKRRTARWRPSKNSLGHKTHC